MTTARLIVSETSGRWSFAWRAALANSGISLTEVMGLAIAFERLHDDSHAILAFEVSEACAEEGLRLLQLSRQRYPGRSVIVLLDGALAVSESLWQETGAVAVVASPRHLAPVARLIRRCFDTRETPPQTFHEDVWQRMPWSESELRS
ncbi:MAG: hypothetical protein O3C40_15720 [Planctomycetota bacterium]|nr:hypothetical protein [Planctomycetota bacterium]